MIGTYIIYKYYNINYLWIRNECIDVFYRRCVKWYLRNQRKLQRLHTKPCHWWRTYRLDKHGGSSQHTVGFLSIDHPLTLYIPNITYFPILFSFRCKRLWSENVPICDIYIIFILWGKTMYPILYIVHNYSFPRLRSSVLLFLHGGFDLQFFFYCKYSYLPYFKSKV